MNGKIDIRLGNINDLPGIIEVYNQGVANGHSTGHTEPLDATQQIPWFERHQADKTPVFVAEFDGTVVGYNALSQYRHGRQAFRYVLETSYYVHGDYHRRGIASALMQHVKEACAQMSVKTLLSFVLAHNRASIEFLEKQGFSRWGLLPDIADFDGIEYNHLIYGNRIENYKN